MKPTPIKIRKLAEMGKWSELRRVVRGMHPYDVSNLLQKIDEETMNEIMSKLSHRLLMEIVPELPEEMQKRFIRTIPPKLAADLLSKLSPDEMTDILENLQPATRIMIMKNFRPRKMKEAKSLLKHSPDTAGGLMTTEFIALRDETTAQDAIDYIREYTPDHSVHYVYVVDSEDRLVGVISLRQLILAPPNEKLKNIMNPQVIKASPEMDQERVANMITDYNLIALPVVDEEGRMLGKITADDAMEVIEEEASEDIARMAGITPAESLVDIPAASMIKSRLPWLVVGLIGGIIAAFVVGSFEETLSSYLTLAMFIPVLVYMSDAVGTQSETIIVRGMAIEPNLAVKKYLFREIKVGAAIAAFCGLLLSVAATLGWGPISFGAIIGVSIFLSILVVTFVAAFLPLFLRKMNIDPAMAAGPFATIISDILTLFIYFTTASIFLTYLL